MKSESCNLNILEIGWCMQKKWKGNTKRLALCDKTTGLVWHDRYKMLLDVQRVLK